MSTRFFLVNVLDPLYYEDCHIRGSINVPLEAIEKWAKNIEKNARIVVYCASYVCPMALTAWMKLHALGFNHAMVYEGGINEWYHMNMPVEGPCRQPYLIDMVVQHHPINNDAGMEQQVAMAPAHIDKIGIEELKKMIANSPL
jgi:rhodanese-related sulfurtransferase